MRPDTARCSWCSFVSAALGAFLLVAGATEATIDGTDWLPLGPAPGEFSYFPGKVSGRATAVAVNPSNADDIWLGTAQGGVWHSRDGGDTWVPTSDQEASLAIGAIALAGCDAQRCSRVYVGTGENAIRRDTFYGQGLLLGRAEGEQIFWELKTGQPYDFGYASIYNVIVDPDTSGSTTVLYVSLSSGTTASATESTVTAPDPVGGFGLYKSSDEANTWEKLTVEGSAAAKPSDLEMDPNDPAVLYAAFQGRGIFKSTDNGTNWCALNPGVPKDEACPDATGLPDPADLDFNHVELATFENDSDILYATFGLCPDPLLAACSPAVYRTLDGGLTWTEQRPGAASTGSGCLKSYSRYTHALAVDPGNSDRLLLGTVNICESTNGGMSFSFSDTNTLGDDIHSDHRQILFYDEDLVFNTNDGGIAISTDGGETWTPKNGNLGTFGFQSIATSPVVPLIIGGAQDNAGQLWVGSRYWEHLNCCGDGGFSVMDFDNGNFMYVTTNVGSVGSTTVLPRKSVNGGNSFFDPGNNGLEEHDDPRSFYPPLVQDPSPPHPLYFGTNRLFRSDDDSINWSIVSPVLSNTPQTEIWAMQDVITAVAIAPSDPDRIYLGHYSGKVFVTDGACEMPACWPQRDTGLPSGAPVTWIAVHPTDPDTAYATFGGFFSGVHTYKTTNGGVMWHATAPHGQLNGVPVNAIAIEPDTPDRLWLGTDIGIYKSTNGGGHWFRFSAGLPNVPVFQIAIDDSRGRVFAGTHGRGAFVITKPFLSNYEGWVDDKIWDIPIYGHGFLSNQTCTVRILQQDLTVCASGSVDAQGGDIETDDDGVLVTSKAASYQGNPVAWACYKGDCVGGTDIDECNEPGNELAAVIAICGPQVGIGLVNGCPAVTAPPSAWTGITGLDNFPNRRSDPEGGGGAPTFKLLPVLYAGDGSTEKMCEVDVPFSATGNVRETLAEARDRVNAAPACNAAGVAAEIILGSEDHIVEDLFPNPDRLTLDAPTRTGGQLVPAIEAAPGQTTGLCFVTDKLGAPVSGQVQIMRTRFTSPTGAAGGSITFVERSPIGRCEITIDTAPGDTAGDIAQKLQDAFQAPGIPGPHPRCPSSDNPRDVARFGDSVITVAARELQLCVDDLGVGFSMAPEEICFVDDDCDDGNPCTRSQCDTARGRCVTEALDDGTRCEDGDACTVGNTCVDGSCGQPLSCEDGDVCTADQCEDGRCRNPPVECEDGNLCTRDFCNQQTGECDSEPLTAPCNDGSVCTVQDTCVLDPGSGERVCRGIPVCNDGNSCTLDQCDEATGFCTNQVYDCDDGNPCTAEFCEGGFCGARPLVGAACDDGDPCTTQEFCADDGQGGAVCTAGAPTCFDEDECTVDRCDSIFGTCDFVALEVPEVEALTLVKRDLLVWSDGQSPPVTTHYNAYRGTIPPEGLASRGAFAYDHVCFESADEFGDGATVSIDRDIPPPGTAFYYDVTREGRCGEGTLGLDSLGRPRSLFDPCPTPP